MLRIVPERSAGVLFEKDFESVRWFDLELNNLNQPLDDDSAGSMVAVNDLTLPSFTFSPLKVKREVHGTCDF